MSKSNSKQGPVTLEGKFNNNSNTYSVENEAKSWFERACDAANKAKDHTFTAGHVTIAYAKGVGVVVLVAGKQVVKATADTAKSAWEAVRSFIMDLWNKFFSKPAPVAA